jgi:hypothetical protein
MRDNRGNQVRAVDCALDEADLGNPVMDRASAVPSRSAVGIRAGQGVPLTKPSDIQELC